MITVILVILATAAGAAALTQGRRYYAVFVGVAGLVVTLLALEYFFGEARLLINWAIALLIGGVIAYFGPRFSRYTLPAAGFFLGGFVADFLLVENGRLAEDTFWSWACFLIGAAVGAYSVQISRDRSLIVLSSLVGSALITEVMSGASAWRAAVFAGLAAAGMLYQSRDYVFREDQVDVALVRLKKAMQSGASSLAADMREGESEPPVADGTRGQP